MQKLRQHGVNLNTIVLAVLGFLGAEAWHDLKTSTQASHDAVIELRTRVESTQKQVAMLEDRCITIDILDARLAANRRIK